MPIAVTDNRIIADSADSITGWSSPVGGTAPSSYTADPVPKELTAHNGVAVSNAESELLFTLGSGVDMSAGTLVYIWALAQGIMLTKASYGISQVIGDGTNTNAYEVGGSDAAVFRHNSGSGVNYQCLVIDTGSLPTGKALRGALGSLVQTAITELGVNFFTSVKAVGGVENCWVDKVIYGNGGLTIIGADTAAYFLDDLSVLDAAGTSGGSYGICRSLGGGIYGIQGKIILGDAIGTGSDTLSIIDQTLKFENFTGIGIDKLGIQGQGNTTGIQTFNFKDSTLFSPVGSGAFLNMSDANIEIFKLDGCLVLNFDQGLDFSINATNAPNHLIIDSNIIGSSQINSGKVPFSNTTIDSTTDINGGWIINSNTDLSVVSGLTFISGGAGHAIYITTTGTFSINNFNFSGYGADATTDAVIYNNSGGAVTLNITGGSGSITVRNGAGSSTTINNAVNLEITVLDNDTGLPINNTARVLMAKDSDNSEIMSQSTDANGIATLSYNLIGDTPFHGWVRQFDNVGIDYVQKDFSGTITSTGFKQTIRLNPVT